MKFSIRLNLITAFTKFHYNNNPAQMLKDIVQYLSFATCSY